MKIFIIPNICIFKIAHYLHHFSRKATQNSIKSNYVAELIKSKLNQILLNQKYKVSYTKPNSAFLYITVIMMNYFSEIFNKITFFSLKCHDIQGISL